MEFLQLRYFITAAEAESFTAAAKKYGVPTSDISQTVKRLEKELGTQLFVRSANRVALSGEGGIFLEGAKKAMSELEGAKRRIREYSDSVSGEIRLLVLTNRRVVTEAIEGFRTLYPEVSFFLSHAGNDDGDFDIVISDEKPGNRVYETVALVEERILLAVGKGCIPESFDENAPSLSAFREARFITMPENSSHCRMTKKICGSSGFAPTIGIMCDDPYYIRKYVEMGLGTAFVPSFSWQGQFSDSIRLCDIGGFTRTTYMFISGKPDEHNRAVKEFVPMLKAAFGKGSVLLA